MEGNFKSGDHLNEWCNLFQHHKNISILSARKHSKSETAHAYLAWRMFKMECIYSEKWLYLSYTGDLAGEHIQEAKERIKVNPFFADYEDRTTAKTHMNYSKDCKRFYCQPSGIMSFKRGKHPDGVITDDILRDPEVKLDVAQIEKINTVFMQQVMSLPKEGGLGVKNIGTPQDEADLFHLLESRKQFTCRRYTAIQDFKEKTVLWKEMFPFERLIEIRDEEIGEKAFKKEYMCVPVRSAEGYFLPEEIDAVSHKRLKSYGIHKKVRLNEYTYGGCDIGKKRHPTHISIFGKDRRGRLVQLVSLWLDNVDYAVQLAKCREIIENFKIERFYYDDTRAEFEGFKEIGQLPPEMKGLNFTNKMKFQIATEFEKRVKSKDIMLLKERRQRGQILNCDNDLKSMETQDGHGDSFWSNALAIHAAQYAHANIRIW